MGCIFPGCIFEDVALGCSFAPRRLWEVLRTAYFVVTRSITSLLFVKLNPTAPSNESHKKVIGATRAAQTTSVQLFSGAVFLKPGQ